MSLQSLPATFTSATQPFPLSYLGERMFHQVTELYEVLKQEYKCPQDWGTTHTSACGPDHSIPKEMATVSEVTS